MIGIRLGGRSWVDGEIYTQTVRQIDGWNRFSPKNARRTFVDASVVNWGQIESRKISIPVIPPPVLYKEY